MSVLLTRRAGSAQTEIVAVHPATGNSSPNPKAHNAPSVQRRGAFFVPARKAGRACQPSQRRAMRGEPQGSPVSFGPVCYPRIVRHPANSSAVADSITKGVHRMNVSPAAPAAPRQTVEIPLNYLAWLLWLASVHHTFTASEAAKLRKAAFRLSAEVGA